MRADPAEFQYLDPREVQGYDSYSAANPVPPVSETPPALLPGATALQEFFVLPAGWFSMIILLLLVNKLPGVPSILVILGGFGTCVWAWFWMQRVGNRDLEEFAAGYTSQQGKTFGSLFMTIQPRITRIYGTNGMVGWDYGSLWVLDSKGRVLRPPQTREGVRPGFYPSPHRRGSLELWTGCEWGDVYREPASPFL